MFGRKKKNSKKLRKKKRKQILPQDFLSGLTYVPATRESSIIL